MLCCAVPRLYNMNIKLPEVLYHNIKTSAFDIEWRTWQHNTRFARYNCSVLSSRDIAYDKFGSHRNVTFETPFDDSHHWIHCKCNVSMLIPSYYCSVMPPSVTVDILWQIFGIYTRHVFLRTKISPKMHSLMSWTLSHDSHHDIDPQLSTSACLHGTLARCQGKVRFNCWLINCVCGSVAQPLKFRAVNGQAQKHLYSV
jgi:hypothetical protein